MATLYIDRMTKQEIINEMMRLSSESTASMLYDIYYLLITDQLTADYLESLGERFNIDLEAEFVRQSIQQQEEDEND